MGRGAILRRLLLVPPTLFGVAVVVFVLLRVVPGDPVSMMSAPMRATFATFKAVPRLTINVALVY